jgi:2-polyprenyl-3-methyl-5-hydroxy-6-metoxy-1,4-benzoquinol methylase
VDAKYGAFYRELFEKHWWWRSRSELIVDELRRLRPSSGWKRILDVGCGDALFFDQLAEFGDVEGVEPCANLVDPDNPHRDRIYVCPFDGNFRPAKQYSLILMLDVLEHLEHPVGALKHALDLLAPGGIVIVTVPAFMTLWTNHDVLNHHLTRYTKQRFREVARRSGLAIQEDRYFYHWTCPVKLAAHIAEGIFHPSPKPPKIPPSWANQALFWISRLEQKTLSPFPVPFGSSLMIVGRKEGPASDPPLEGAGKL